MIKWLGASMKMTAWGMTGAVLAGVDLLAFYVGVHPSIWGGREFSGMIETLMLMLFVYAATPVLLILLVIGMIRKDLLSYIVLAAMLLMVPIIWASRDSNVHA
jgi:hypothetical protein